MTTETSKKPKLPEFIFGKLSTKEGRLQQARLARLGFYHDLLLSPADPRPGEAITLSVKVGVEIAVKRVNLFYATDGEPLAMPPDKGNPSLKMIPMQRSAVRWDTITWDYLEEWAGEIPGQAAGTHVQYLIQGMTTQGQLIYSPTIDMNAAAFVANRDEYDLKYLEKLEREKRPLVYGFTVDEERIPDWFHEAVIYQIFAERFAPDPGEEFASPDSRMGFYGGTIKGIISRLDYLSELGINCLWLTPIFPSPSHHGYDPTDYGTVEPRLGSDGIFQSLLDEAHGRGIRVVIDFVANHCSNQHPAFVAAQQDKNSESYRWFRFSNWPDQYGSYFDIPHHPRLNADEPGVRAYLFSHAQKWLERGVDGFRLDHAHGSTHAFWSAFRQATRETRPDSVTFGEITETPAFIRSYNGRMDGCLDFRLTEALRAFFAYGALKPSEFDKFLGQHFAYFNDGLVLPSFLDNHDMNRFLWLVKGDTRRLHLAALCHFTLPGPPIVYYGTEVGLSQLTHVGPLEESRLPMLWGEEQDRELLAFYKQLIALRRQTQDIWRLPRETLLVDDDRGLYAYACGAYVVVLNNSGLEAGIALEDGRELALVLATDAGIKDKVQNGKLYLPPYAGAIFEDKDEPIG